MTTLRTLLRAARERRGFSREALAYHSGLSGAAIAQLESGRRADVRVSSLSALAEALSVSTDYLAGRAVAVPPPMFEHQVLLYGSDDELLATVVPFLQEGLRRSDALLVVTSRAHIARVGDALGDDASRVLLADAGEWYSSPSAAVQRYRTFIDDRLEDGFGWVRIVGEPVWAGRSAAEIKAWTRYESVLNLSFAMSPATVVCPYDTRLVPAGVALDAQRTHPGCLHAGVSTMNASYLPPEQFLL
jgi:transcriptional regulator with XRE-family HTH domain